MLLFWLRCKIKFRLVKQCSTGGMFSLTGGGRARNPPQVLKPPPCHHPPKCPHEASPTHHHVHQPNHQPTTTNPPSPPQTQPQPTQHQQPLTTILPAHYKPINSIENSESNHQPMSIHLQPNQHSHHFNDGRYFIELNVSFAQISL